MSPFDEELKARLDDIRAQGLLRELRRVDSAQGPRIRIDGREFLNFSSNDYLGLANHPALTEAAIRATKDFGAGAGASRLICGSLAPFHELEESLAAFKVLKHERPEILVIVLTEASDSELVIELINQAQIFRFINKPVKPELLKQHTQSALTRYQSFKQNPHLMHQHKVAPAPAQEVSKNIFDRVKSLKGWF